LQQFEADVYLAYPAAFQDVREHLMIGVFVRGLKDRDIQYFKTSQVQNIT